MTISKVSAVALLMCVSLCVKTDEPPITSHRIKLTRQYSIKLTFDGNQKRYFGHPSSSKKKSSHLAAVATASSMLNIDLDSSGGQVHIYLNASQVNSTTFFCGLFCPKSFITYHISRLDYQACLLQDSKQQIYCSGKCSLADFATFLQV